MLTKETILKGLQETASTAIVLEPQGIFKSTNKRRFTVYVDDTHMVIETDTVSSQWLLKDLVMLLVEYTCYNVFALTIVYLTSENHTLHTTIKMQLDKRLRLDKSCKSIY